MPASTAAAPETVPTTGAASAREISERAWVKILEAARRIDVLVAGLHPREPNRDQLVHVECEASGRSDALREYADACTADVPGVRQQLLGAAFELHDIEALAVLLRRVDGHVHQDTVQQMVSQMGDLSRRLAARVAHSRNEADHDVPALWLSGAARTGEWRDYEDEEEEV